jgi:hypothetical protein
MRSGIALLLILMSALAACARAPAGQTVAATPTPTPDGAPAATAAATTVPDGKPGAATPEPIPSDFLGDFSCDLPIVEPASQPVVTNILDVRVGMHDGYDRGVFEFSAGTPELTLDRGTPPFRQDGSGFPVEVEGDSFLALVMRGATKQTEDGTSSYDGPTDFDPGFPQLVDLVEGGDFEAQSTWYLGLASEACVRLTLLADPDRVVIDIEH